MMRNIDYNAYRAFKMANNEDNSNKKKNAYELFRKEQNSMRFPFDLKEKRFRWQTSKNLGEKWELKGNIVKRVNLNNSAGDWESLMQRTGSLPPTKSLKNK